MLDKIIVLCYIFPHKKQILINISIEANTVEDNTIKKEILPDNFTPTTTDSSKISIPQAKRLLVIAKNHNLTNNDIYLILKKYNILLSENIENKLLYTCANINKKDYASIIDYIITFNNSKK